MHFKAVSRSNFNSEMAKYRKVYVKEMATNIQTCSVAIADILKNINLQQAWHCIIVVLHTDWTIANTAMSIMSFRCLPGSNGQRGYYAPTVLAGSDTATTDGANLNFDFGRAWSYTTIYVMG